MRRLLLTTTITLTALSATANATTQLVIIDNAGTLQKAGKSAFTAKKALLQKLSSEGAGFFEDDEIIVVLTHSGNVEFQKPASMLPSTAGVLVPHLKAQPVCNNLVEAMNTGLRKLRSLSVDKQKKAHVHLFSSLIHTPSTCNDYVADVPQPVPAELDLSFLAKSHIPLTVYWAQNTQRKIWERHMTEAGVNAKVFGVIETMSHLGVEGE